MVFYHLKGNSLCVCVCVCACVRARARACVCVVLYESVGAQVQVE